MRCIEQYIKRNTFSDKIKDEMKNCAGMFSVDHKNLARFCEIYIEAMSCADIIALWGVGAEPKIVHSKCKNSKFIYLMSLEPYYFSDPWSYALKGKKVLIIHPFKETIEKQYMKRWDLFENKHILPEFLKFRCLKAIQTAGGNISDFQTWFDALDYMKEQIDQIDFDIAIIGAGAYGLPLACHCKMIGKQAVQMSGATQILFGIKGKRWDHHQYISKYYNEQWVRPLDTEKPMNSEKIEGGCYW